MKKVLVLFAAALTGLTTVHAQDAGSEGVRFGLKLSPNMGWGTSETKDLGANGSGFGYTFGLLTEFPIGNTGNYRFATGINLNNLVAKWKQDFEYLSEINGPTRTKELTTEAKLQYLEVPLTVKLMTNEIGYMRYFAQVGFGAAFNIRARANMVIPKYYAAPAQAFVETFEELDKENISDDINIFKASLIVGGGLEYNFSGNTSLLAGITYNNGFTNIANFDADAGKKADLRAHYLELTLGLFF
ncbi:MAG TPA: porin family protein [Flavobacteriales bacterium]|nr:porin family protein [Flavobacteriales bacterium]